MLSPSDSPGRPEYILRSASTQSPSGATIEKLVGSAVTGPAAENPAVSARTEARSSFVFAVTIVGFPRAGPTTATAAASSRRPARGSAAGSVRLRTASKSSNWTAWNHSSRARSGDPATVDATSLSSTKLGNMRAMSLSASAVARAVRAGPSSPAQPPHRTAESRSALTRLQWARLGHTEGRLMMSSICQPPTLRPRPERIASSYTS